MAYLINDFTGLLIGLFLVYSTFEITNKMTSKPYTSTLPVPIETSVLFVIVPVLVWYFYQVLLNIGPKGTSKAIKI